MGFLGFANVYAMRVNLSVAIVAMVNNTAIATNASRVNNATCPVAGNTTQAPPDGPFAWGAREQGWLLGAFFFGYVVTQLPGGRAAERWGGKRLYGGGVLVTAVFTLLTPLAAHSSIYLLVLVRVLEGLGEGVTFPVMHALLAVWAPPGERSRMAGFVYSGAQAGTVLSLPISGLLCDAYGWESVFYVFGLLGVVWWLAWCYLVHDSPSTHPHISDEERNHILASLADAKLAGPTAAVPWRAIATSGPVWALLIGHVAQNYGFYTLLTELPTYMANVLHFDIKANSLVSALPYLVMLTVSLLVTPLADRLLAAGADRTTVRKVFNSVSIYLPAGFLVAAAYSGCDTTLTVILLCLAVGCNGCQYAGFMCCHLDLASNYAGTLLGITNCAANFMGFVAPAVAGYVTEGQSDLPHWRLVFFIAAVVYVAGNTVFLVWGSAKEQPWNLEPGRRARVEEEEPSFEQDDY
jgi:ACS family sodium-dependent inorganic phosphate cotransporter-like MFS transporter 5